MTMTIYEAYVKIEGSKFDVARFAELAFAASVEGRIEYRAKDAGKPVSQAIPRWESSSIRSREIFDEAAFRHLITRLQAVAGQYGVEPPTTIMATVVVRCDPEVCSGGLWFSPDTLDALKALGAHVDIDIVPLVAEAQPDRQGHSSLQ